MLRQIKALSGQTLIYGFGQVLARSVTFLLLPLYTNLFTPADYGTLSLAYAFMGFMVVILHYGIDAALMKRYIHSDGADRQSYFSTAWLSLLITAVAFALLVALFREALAGPVLGSGNGRFMVYLAVILALDVMWSLPQLALRSENRPLAYIGFSLLNVALSLSLNLVFVLHLHWGVEGALMSNLIASSVVFLVSLPIALRRLNFRRISREHWRNLMRFGLPFLPAGLFAMLMELADRYLLRAITDIPTVGLYSAGHKLGALMLLVVMGFNLAWHPFFLKQGDQPGSPRLFARVSTYVLASLGLLWILMLVWVPHLVRLQVGPVSFYGPEYWQSVAIMPWIALGYIGLAAYLLQMPAVFLKERTRLVAVTRGAGAGVNISLNLLLIPTYGALGAAWASCSSFLLMALLFWLLTRRIYPIPYEWSRLVRIAGSLGLAAALYQFTDASLWRDVGLSLVYPALLLFSGFLSAEEWSFLRRRESGASSD